MEMARIRCSARHFSSVPVTLWKEAVVVTTTREDMARNTEYWDIALRRREIEKSDPTPPYDDSPPTNDDYWRGWDDGWRGLTLFQVI